MLNQILLNVQCELESLYYQCQTVMNVYMEKKIDFIKIQKKNGSLNFFDSDACSVYSWTTTYRLVKDTKTLGARH